MRVRKPSKYSDYRILIAEVNQMFHVFVHAFADHLEVQRVGQLPLPTLAMGGREPGDRSGKLNGKRITLRVSVAIVDVFEVIEIEQQERVARLASHGPLERVKRGDHGVTSDSRDR